MARIASAPPGLGASGKALWRLILADLPDGYELAPRELHLLKRACRVADEIALLEASIDRAGVTVTGSRGQPVLNRALEEVRLARMAEAKLLTLLDLDEPEGVASPATRRARKAANVRWSRRNLHVVEGAG